MLVFGVLLLGVALVLLLVEAHLSTGGLIAGGALLAVVLGVALLLVAVGAAWPLVLAVVLGVGGVSGGGLLVAARSLRSVRRLRPRSGPESMVGHVGAVRVGDRDPHVFVDGGLWRAQPSWMDEGQALHDGDRVIVERVNGLTLCVRRAEEWELTP